MPYPVFNPLVLYTEPSQEVLDNATNTYNGMEVPEEQTIAGTPASWLDQTIDFSALEEATGRRADSDYLNYIYKKLRSTGMDDIHASAIIGTISEESGGDPYAASDTGAYQGIMQWADNRYHFNPFYEDNSYKELDRQIDYLLESLSDTKDGKSWIDPETKGGSGKWAMEEFWDTDDLSRANYLLNKYYVRPHKQEEDIPRRDIASQQALNIIGASKPAGIAALDRSNAPFARDLRMGSEQRGSLVDSYYPMQEANYKMAYGSDDEGAYVYPMIQKEGDELIDYSRAPYDTFAADDAAHESGNLVRMPEEDAQWVAENNYKNYYPGFNSFAEGGNTWNDEILRGDAIPVPPEV